MNYSQLSAYGISPQIESTLLLVLGAIYEPSFPFNGHQTHTKPENVKVAILDFDNGENWDDDWVEEFQATWY